MPFVRWMSREMASAVRSGKSWEKLDDRTLLVGMAHWLVWEVFMDGELLGRVRGTAAEAVVVWSFELPGEDRGAGGSGYESKPAAVDALKAAVL